MTHNIVNNIFHKSRTKKGESGCMINYARPRDGIRSRQVMAPFARSSPSSSSAAPHAYRIDVVSLAPSRSLAAAVRSRTAHMK